MEMVKSGWMVDGTMNLNSALRSWALEVLSMTCSGLDMDSDLEFEM